MTDKNTETLSEEQLKKEINLLENQEKSHITEIGGFLGLSAIFTTASVGLFIANANIDVSPIPASLEGKKRIEAVMERDFKCLDKAGYAAMGYITGAMGFCFALASTLPIGWYRTVNRQKKHYQALLEQSKIPER